MLVQVCGLPGTGKSTLAARVAAARGAVLLRIDAIEAAMWRNGLERERTGIAAYSVAHAVALPHLQRGLGVVADAVSAVEAARAGWRSTAERAGAPLRVVEAVLHDPAEHRRRVTTRVNDLDGFELPTWEQVQAGAAHYEPRSDDRLVVDTSRPLEDCVAEVLEWLDRG